MTELPQPTTSWPTVVGPYTPDGRTVWVLRYDGTFAHPGLIENRASFDLYVETQRPAAVCGPPAPQIRWLGDPDHWPS